MYMYMYLPCHCGVPLLCPCQVKTLCIDKELLISRNRSLAAELHKRETCHKMAGVMMNGGRQGCHAPSLVTNTSEYEVMVMSCDVCGSTHCCGCMPNNGQWQ